MAFLNEVDMTASDVIIEIPKLSFADRVAILVSIAQSLREPVTERSERLGTADRLRGLLKPALDLPSDWDWKKAKEEYLAEKYLR